MGKQDPRVFAKRIEVDAEHTSFDVEVFRAAVVNGRVIGADGTGVAGVGVRVLSCELDQPIFSWDASTSAGGAFSFSVLEATYRVSVLEASGPGKTLPASVVVAAKVGLPAFVEFDLSPGDCSITGLLVDPPLLDGESELRWSAMPVLVLPEDPPDRAANIRGLTIADRVASTVTDDKGRFIVDGLQPGTYGVGFGLGEYSSDDPNCRLASPVRPVVVQLERGETVDLGSTWLPRARPCVVRGSFDLGGRAPHEVDLRIQFPPNSLRSTRPYMKRVRLDADGHFETFVHTNPDGMDAVAHWRYIGEEEWRGTLPIPVIPHGEQIVVLPR